MQAKHLVRFFERRVVREYRLEVRNSIAALTGLAVGHTQKAPPKRSTHARKYFAPVGKRNATDKMDIARRHAATSPGSVDRPEHRDQRRKVHPSLALRHGLCIKLLRLRGAGASLLFLD